MFKIAMPRDVRGLGAVAEVERLKDYTAQLAISEDFSKRGLIFRIVKTRIRITSYGNSET